VTCAVAVVRRFNPSLGPVRRVRLIIIAMHIIIREIIPGRE